MRILIATVTAGAGHLHAAAALEEAWRARRPKDIVEKVDVLDLVPKLQKKVYAESYLKLVEHAPELWALVFKKTDNPQFVRKLTRFRRAWASHTNRHFVRHLKAFQADAVLCVHYLPLEILGHLEGNDGITQPFTVCVVTDFEAHALWMESCVDLYCVAAEETKARLVARGADPMQVVATGIPIAAKFAGRIDTAAVRKALGLRDDLPILLVLGGGFGMGPVGEILAQLDKVQRPFQTLVAAGRNQELRRELASQDRKHPTQILGFVTNMHELMAISDLIITKPGGLTSSEALAMGKPILILDPIPGQEAANSDFLLERGAASKVNRVEDLPFRVNQLFGSKKLEQLAAAASGLGRRQAAQNVCCEVVQRLEAKL